MSVLRNPKNIKELLKIDIDFLFRNSVFKADLISGQNDSRNLLLFELTSSFLGLFNHFQVSMFDKKAKHLEFIGSNINDSEIKKLIDLLVNEYGKDENGQRSHDWNTSKNMSWWFKNENHEPSYDDYDHTDDSHYGIMISENKTTGLEFSILDYSNIDIEFDKNNWLEHG